MWEHPVNCDCRTLSAGATQRDVTAGTTVGSCWRHGGHVHDDVTTTQPLHDLFAARRDLDVNLVRVLVVARLARPDVSDAGAALLHSHLSRQLTDV